MTNSTPAIGSLQEQQSPRVLRWDVVFQLAVLAVLFLLVYRPPLQLMIYKWSNDGNWSHGWLVPLFSLYFIGVHRSELLAAERRPNYLGLVVLVGALALYYGSYLWRFGYPQKFSIVPCLLGLVLLVGGWQILKVVWFPIAFLVFAIPLPTSLYFYMTLPLRRLASQVAGGLLRLLPEVDTQVTGVVVDYGYRGRLSSLNVEEACSGMRLMMAFCSLGVAMAYLGDRPLWHRVVMVICCIPIAVFCNTLRVFITGVLHVYGYETWAQGSAHAILGLAMLGIALGLFAFISYVLNNLFVEDSEELESA